MEYFSDVMRRDQLKRIRYVIPFYVRCDHDVATKDHFWHRILNRQHLLCNFVKAAVNSGDTSFDKIPVLCKGLKEALSYMKSKEVKFGTSFNVNVYLKSRNIHTLRDNGYGNKTGVTPAIAYDTQKRKSGASGPVHV